MNIHSRESSTTITTLPTAPASAVRLRLFQPSRRPVHADSGWLETPWGKCKVKGRLGQAHADILELIMHTAMKTAKADDGRIHVLCDPAEIRRRMGSGSQYSYEQMIKLLSELTEALMMWEANITTKSGKITSKGMGHIIDSVTETKTVKHNPLGGADRHLLGVTISPAWAKLINDDIGLFYDPSTLAGMHGVTQSVARLMLSHDASKLKNGVKVDTIIEQIGISAGRHTRKARECINDDTIKLLKCGILLENKTLKRVKCE